MSTRANFSLVGVLADPVVVREWNMGGLPIGDYSTENAIFATRSKRWPLAIDPQSQGNRWIKSSEAKHSLRVVRAGESGVLRSLELGIRNGSSVLLEEVGEELEPSLETVLQKRTYRQGLRTLIRVGDCDIWIAPCRRKA